MRCCDLYDDRGMETDARAVCYRCAYLLSFGIVYLVLLYSFTKQIFYKIIESKLYIGGQEGMGLFIKYSLAPHSPFSLPFLRSHYHYTVGHR